MVSKIPVRGGVPRVGDDRVGSKSFSGVFTANVKGVGPGSVRDVAILGSTSTTTVCNSRTTGNIVIIAAGENRTKDASIDCSKAISIGAGPSHDPGLVGSERGLT